MNTAISHEDQKRIWNEEHQNPYVLLPMDALKAPSSLVLFWNWFQQNYKDTTHLKALEMGCGKGRNSLWLAQQGVDMEAFGFSEIAIEEANQRADSIGVLGHIRKSW